MTTTITQQQLQQSNVFATVEIKDAILKFNIYIGKLITLEELNDERICRKIIKLAIENFGKYNDNDEYTKAVYDLLKPAILNKRSFYMLYIFDLCIKSNKYFLKNGKKEVESMLKSVWEKIWTEYQNKEKLEDLKVMIRCWGWIYGDKLEENIRKWLDQNYHIKKIELNADNEQQMKEVYGEKNETEILKTEKFNELLRSSIGEDGPSSSKYANLSSSNDKKEENTIANNNNISKKVDKKLLEALDLDDL